MQLRSVIAAAALLGLVSTAAEAAQIYDFSYKFDTSDTITGSFTGTDLGGGLVGDLTNITAKFDGTALVGSGSLSAFSYTAPGQQCSTCFTLGGAVASTNPLDNNFFLTDAASVAALTGGHAQNYFYVIPWPGPNNTEGTQYYSASLPGNYVDFVNSQYIPGNWSLTTVSPVPLPGALPLFGSALVGVGALAARRRAKKAA